MHHGSGKSFIVVFANDNTNICLRRYKPIKYELQGCSSVAGYRSVFLVFLPAIISSSKQPQLWITDLSVFCHNTGHIILSYI